MNKKIKIIIIVAAIIVGYIYYANSLGWKKYSNAKCGFEVMVPKKWKISEELPCLVNIVHSKSVKGDYVTFGRVDIAYNERKNKDMNFYQDKINALKKEPIVDNFQEFRIDGVEGYKGFKNSAIGIGEATTSIQIFRINKDNRVYIINGSSQDVSDSNYKKEIEKVISSFQYK